MGYGYDCLEWLDTDDRRNLLTLTWWLDLMAEGCGEYLHWCGARYGPNAGIQAGELRWEGILWNTKRRNQYASWERHELKCSEEELRAQVTNQYLRGRPSFNEDRHRMRVPPRYADKDPQDEARVLADVRRAGSLGIGIIVGKYDPSTKSQSNRSDVWERLGDFRALGAELDAVRL